MIKKPSLAVSYTWHSLQGKIVVFAAFFMLNLPTIKYFVPTEILNIFPLCILSMLMLVSKRLPKRTLVDMVIMSLMCVYFVTLLVYGIFENYSFNYFYLSKYLVILFTTGLIYVLYDSESLDSFLSYNLVWGGLISVLYLLGFIDMSRINYLQVGHPMACTLIISVISIFCGKKLNFSSFIYCIFCCVVSLASLLSLYGRSPLIFPIVVIVIFISVSLFQRNKLIGIVIIISSIVILGGAINTILNMLPPQLQYRLTNIEDTMSEEPRLITWGKAIDYISSNLIGYGPESSVKLLGYVPHNFLLESGISIGLFGIVLVLLIFLIIVWYIIKSFILQKRFKILAGITLYYFMRYQIGGAIGSSYDFFVISFILVLSINNQEKLRLK